MTNLRVLSEYRSKIGQLLVRLRDRKHLALTSVVVRHRFQHVYYRGEKVTEIVQLWLR